LNIIKNKQQLTNINSYLLIAFAFALPISVAITNLIAALVFIIWILRGTFKSDFNYLKNNKFVLAIMAFLSLHYVGFLWTEDVYWGAYVFKKELKFLLLPIFMLFVKREHIRYYIYAFLLAMTLSEIVSYSIWFELIPPFKSATVYDPTPFMSHIHYNPFLTIAIYLLLYRVLFDKVTDNKEKILYILFIVSMSINMFITGGRAGQVIYFLMLIIVLFQYFNRYLLKAFILSLVLVPSIFFISYNSSDIFKNRIDLIAKEIKSVDVNPNTSIGTRITYIKYSWEIIKNNPIIGVGTGDFKKEFELLHKKYNPTMKFYVHPHNMYLLVLGQFGIFGLLSLLSIFYFAIKFSLNSSNLFIKRFGFTLPILIMVIMLSDSYLFSHYTTLLFIFFSAILYKDYGDSHE
jgi:O-antigen ligase